MALKVKRLLPPKTHMSKRHLADASLPDKKKSRWDSDSDAEPETEAKESAEDTTAPADDPPNSRDAAATEYNPLWFGCRSVDRYEPLNRIDEGTYGVVFRAKDTETGQIWALKKVRLPSCLVCA